MKKINAEINYQSLFNQEYYSGDFSIHIAIKYCIHDISKRGFVYGQNFFISTLFFFDKFRYLSNEEHKVYSFIESYFQNNPKKSLVFLKNALEKPFYNQTLSKDEIKEDFEKIRNLSFLV